MEKTCKETTTKIKWSTADQNSSASTKSKSPRNKHDLTGTTQADHEQSSASAHVVEQSTENAEPVQNEINTIETTRPSSANTVLDQRGKGMVDDLIGATYQQQLQVLMVCQVAKQIAENENLEFSMTSEDPNAGIFDDIGFSFDHGGQCGELLIQAKYKQNTDISITWDDLTSIEKRAPFAICKYLESFLEKQPDWIKQNKQPVIVLCTNIGLTKDTNALFAKYPFGERFSPIIDSMVKSISRNAYIMNFKTSKRLCDYLKDQTELSKLAKQIAQYIFKKKKIDDSTLFQKYRYIIENKIVIENQVKKEPSQNKTEGSETNNSLKVNQSYFDQNKELKQAFEREYKFQYMLNDIRTKGIKIANDKTFNEITENSLQNESKHSTELVKLLVHHIYFEKLLSFDDIMCNECSKFIVDNILVKKNTKIIFVQTDTNYKQCKVNTSFLSNKTHREFKMLFEEEYMDLLEKDKHKIWVDIREKGIHLIKQFPTNEQSLPMPLKEEDLDAFCKCFVFLCDTNHEESTVVASILENKLLPAELQGFISSEITYAKLSKTILNLITNKEGKCFTRQDTLDVFNNIALMLRFSQLQGLSNAHCNQFWDIRLKYMQAKLEEKNLYQNLQNWLSEPESAGKGFNLTFERCTNLALAFAVLQNCKGRWEKIFLTSEWTSNARSREDLLEIFHDLKFSLILVVDCDLKAKIVEWLKDKTCAYQRMILTVENCKSPDSKEDIYIADLTDKCRNGLFEQNTIICGTSIPNKELFKASDSMNMFQNVQNPDATSIKRNICAESFEKIKKKFISRHWRRCVSESVYEISSEDFWRRKRNNRLIPDTLTSEATNEMTIENFLERNTFYKMRVDLIDDDEAEEHTDIPGIEPNFNEGFKEIENKIHVILNEAGYGKTFYMTWLANELQSRESTKKAWIIRLNLCEYSNDFLQFQNDWQDTECSLNANDALRQLFQLIYLTFVTSNKFDAQAAVKRQHAQEVTKLLLYAGGSIRLHGSESPKWTTEQIMLLRLFVSKFNSRKIFILMDGFDEITPYYTQATLNLLSVLRKFEGIQKIYLSSRPHGFKAVLQRAFGVCSFYRLVEFNRTDQCKYVRNFLKEKFDSDDSMKEEDKNKIIKVATSLLLNFHGNLMELPLFLFMGLELLLPLISKHINLEGNKISTKIIKDCEKQFSPLNMIESYIDKKLSIEIEKKGANVSQASTRAEKDKKMEEVKKVFSRLALFAVMHDEVTDLLTYGEHKDSMDYMEKIRNGFEKSGICEGVIHDKPLYIHRLFAEYFAALWFFNQTTDQSKWDEKKHFIKYHIYESSQGREIKFFLDCMICKEQKLHMAVLDHSISKVASLLETSPSLLKNSDKWGRIPLHLAVAYWPKENDNMVSLLLDADKTTISSKDKFFNWSVIDYAHVNDKLNGKGAYFELYFVLKLLKMGASINNDETFTRFHSQNLDEMIAEALPLAFHLKHELLPSLGQKCTTHIMKNLFKEVQLKMKLQQTMKIRTNKLFTMLNSFDANLAKRLNQDTVYCLELFAIADSTEFASLPRKQYFNCYVYLTIILVFLSGVIAIVFFCFFVFSDIISPKFLSLPHFLFLAFMTLFCLLLFLSCSSLSAKSFGTYKKMIHLAYEYRSINFLRYLYAKCGWVEYLQSGSFEQELLYLLLLMHENEQMFRSCFHKYCTRHKIACCDKNELPENNDVESSDVGEQRVSLQGELWHVFPIELITRSEIGIDNGTEFLLSKALQSNNVKIIEYIVRKTNVTINNQLIKSMLKNCQIDWRCQTSFHSFIESIPDFMEADESGRTLLHIAIEQASLNLVICLINDYNFNATDTNKKEKNINAFFYCVCEYSDNFDVRQKIFTFLMQKYVSYDCFENLDSDGKSVFYYSVKNNRLISDYIIERTFSIKPKDFNAGHIRYLVKLLKASGFNAKEVVIYFSHSLTDDPTFCKDVIQALKDNKMLGYTDENNRNILHISIINNWFLFIKCLVKSLEFKILEPNTQEKYWNSFFYCVSEKTTASKTIRKQIFQFLLKSNSEWTVDDMDTTGRSVFFYATETNTEIAKIIFTRECQRTETFPISCRITELMRLLENSNLNAFQKWLFLEENSLIDETSVKEICNNLQSSLGLKFVDKKRTRNLLHTAIMEGWFFVTKCLIEHYGFELEKMNSTEFNWNAFFYCVASRQNAKEKLNIFTFLMNKYSMDCLNQIDSREKSVLWYAAENNRDIAKEICDYTPKWTESVLNETQTSVLLETLENQRFNIFEKLKFLEINELINFQSVKTICNYCKTNGDLESKERKTGRNLLHSAVHNGWYEMVKCFVKNDFFNVLEINGKEYGWNVFFYCVTNNEKPRDKFHVFVYLMLKYPMNFFEQLDSTGKSVFYYANKNNKDIAHQIFQQEWQLSECLPIDERISSLMQKTKNSITSTCDKIHYFVENKLVNEHCARGFYEYLKKTGNLHDKQKKNGRNLLHSAIIEGWVTLTECLIEHNVFEVNEFNEKDNCWNAFFYCVCKHGQQTEKLRIFTYLIDKFPMDCLERLDKKSRSVFSYATIYNDAIGMKIFSRHCELTENLPIEERLQVLMGILQNSPLNIFKKLQYLEENNVVDERSVGRICEFLKKTGELNGTAAYSGMNLLQFTLSEGWFILTKCLIERHSFNVFEINKTHKSWNAFFFCVHHPNKPIERLNIFVYLMEKYEIDCFNQLDSDDRSMFFYALIYNREIAMKIFQRQCELMEKLPIEEKVPLLLHNLYNSTLTAIGKWMYLHKFNVVDEKSVRTIYENIKETRDPCYRDKITGRTLLHTAVLSGWIILAKFLTDELGSDAMQINKREKNWNTFFYCTVVSSNSTERMNLFTYLMEKYPTDCFTHLDAVGRCLFFYATKANESLAKEIFKREFFSIENCSKEEKIAHMICKLEVSLQLGYVMAKTMVEQYLESISELR